MCTAKPCPAVRLGDGQSRGAHWLLLLRGLAPLRTPAGCVSRGAFRPCPQGTTPAVRPSGTLPPPVQWAGAAHFLSFRTRGPPQRALLRGSRRQRCVPLLGSGLRRCIVPRPPPPSDVLERLCTAGGGGGSPPPSLCQPPPPFPVPTPPPLLPFQCLRLTAKILLRRLRCQAD